MINEKTKSLLGILLIVVLFIFFTYLVQENIEIIKGFIGEGIFGMLVYILVSIIAVVIAPISTLPLISVVSNIWGVVVAAILSILAWTIGAIIAFLIARKYGVLLVQKFISIKKIHKIEEKIPKEHLFWSVVFLRMIVPVDILSYALGLFSKIKTKEYIFATLIGITPFAFIFAYLGNIPYYYQIPVFLIVLIIILIGLIVKKHNHKK